MVGIEAEFIIIQAKAAKGMKRSLFKRPRAEQAGGERGEATLQTRLRENSTILVPPFLCQESYMNLNLFL